MLHSEAYYRKRIDKNWLPRHIAVIMDGNGRWAKREGLLRAEGHKRGAKTFREIAIFCRDFGIRYFTVYAFSTENWKRSDEEVGAIMELLRLYVEELIRDHEINRVRICFPGDRGARIAPELRERMNHLCELTAHYPDTVNIAVNYGGRDEILRAALLLHHDLSDGTCAEAEVDEKRFSGYLYTAGQPDPDLIIRPSGEQRISNFLLWQCAYSEFYFTKTLWPDFRPVHILAALLDYQRRDRRFGGRPGESRARR